MVVASFATISSCTPLQKEAWRAGQAGEPFPSLTTAPASVAPAGNVTRSANRQPIESNRALSSDLYVEKNINSGEFILLSNGALMQIDPFERLDAMLWLILDEVKVIPSDRGSIGYDFLIINLSERTQAHAKVNR